MKKDYDQASSGPSQTPNGSSLVPRFCAATASSKAFRNVSTTKSHMLGSQRKANQTSDDKKSRVCGPMPTTTEQHGGLESSTSSSPVTALVLDSRSVSKSQESTGPLSHPSGYYTPKSHGTCPTRARATRTASMQSGGKESATSKYPCGARQSRSGLATGVGEFHIGHSGSVDDGCCRPRNGTRDNCHFSGNTSQCSKSPVGSHHSWKNNHHHATTKPTGYASTGPLEQNQPAFWSPTAASVANIAVPTRQRSSSFSRLPTFSTVLPANSQPTLRSMTPTGKQKQRVSNRISLPNRQGVLASHGSSASLDDLPRTSGRNLASRFPLSSNTSLSGPEGQQSFEAAVAQTANRKALLDTFCFDSARTVHSSKSIAVSPQRFYSEVPKSVQPVPLSASMKSDKHIQTGCGFESVTSSSPRAASAPCLVTSQQLQTLSSELLSQISTLLQHHVETAASKETAPLLEVVNTLVQEVRSLRQSVDDLTCKTARLMSNARRRQTTAHSRSWADKPLGTSWFDAQKEQQRRRSLSNAATPPRLGDLIRRGSTTTVQQLIPNPPACAVRQPDQTPSKPLVQDTPCSWALSESMFSRCHDMDLDASQLSLAVSTAQPYRETAFVTLHEDDDDGGGGDDDRRPTWLNTTTDTIMGGPSPKLTHLSSSNAGVSPEKTVSMLAQEGHGGESETTTCSRTMGFDPNRLASLLLSERQTDLFKQSTDPDPEAPTSAKHIPPLTLSLLSLSPDHSTTRPLDTAQEGLRISLSSLRTIPEGESPSTSNFPLPCRNYDAVPLIHSNA